MKTNNIIAAIAINSSIALAMATSLKAATYTKTYGTGFLGATLTANMSRYSAPQSGVCNFYASGRADGRVFYNSFNLASGSANFQINSGSNSSRAWGYLNLGSSTIAKWDKTMTGTSNFGSAPQTLTKKVGLDLGVITVGAGVSITTRAEGKITCGLNSSGRTQVSVTCGPAVDAAVIGNGSVNIIVASGGLNGQVSLCKMALNAGAYMTPSTNPLQPNSSNVSYALSFRSETLSGKLTAWWDIAGPSGGSKPYSYTGFTTTKTLDSGFFALNRVPILK